MPLPTPADFRDRTKKHSQVRELLAQLAENVLGLDIANANAFFKPQVVAQNTNVNLLGNGFWIIPSDSVAATLTGLPPQLTQPRRGFIFCIRTGTTNYQKFTRDMSVNCEAYERTGNGLGASDSNFVWNDYTPVINGSHLTALENALKAWANSNPRFSSVVLTGTENFDTLPEGRYFIPSSVVATALDAQLPPTATSPKIGWIEKTCYSNALIELVFSRYTINSSGEYESYKKMSNGGSTGFAWLPWQKQVSRYEYNLHKASVDDAIATMKTSKAEINLFQNYALTSEYASTYQATLADENGYPTLTMNTGGVTLVAYDMNIVANIVDIGKTISFSAEGYCSATSFNGGDLSIQALNSSGAVIQASTSSYITTANTWQKILNTLTIPAGTAKIRLRLINRNGTGNTVCKFRNATLISDYVFLKYVNPAQSSSSSVDNIFFVAKTGNDSNKGTANAPFLTIQKAVDSLPQGGIIEVAGGEYRETVTVSTNANLWIRSKRGQRAKILGSEQLTVTKTAGYTQVYQAPLAAKPVGMGGGRGQPVIFEYGTPSKPVIESERHFLHRGHTHRLAYTEMFEAASLAELDTAGGRGKWWWDAGVIYFAAKDGSDATLKRYEARVRSTLVHSNGAIHLTRIDTYFSTAEGGQFNGVYTKREDCRTFGNYFNGYSDNANFTESYRDEAGGNGNDGFNGTVTSYADATDETTRIESVYFDPYGHDNGDDGLSDHFRGDVTIYGGLFEYNTKADVVHVTGANCVCYNTEARGTLNGFYAATATTGDSSRVKTVFRCVGTKATGNTYSYRAGDDAILDCENAKSINPSSYGYYQTGAGAINAADCKYTGDPAKMKSGTVNVTNHNALT